MLIDVEVFDFLYSNLTLYSKSHQMFTILKWQVPARRPSPFQTY